MKRFTDAGRAAVDAGNLYAGLSLALMIPDICGSLEDAGPGKSKERYTRWFSAWAEPKFTFGIGVNNETQVFVSAEDCYSLRCSLIHSGQSYVSGRFNRFEFFDDTGNVHLNAFEIPGQQGGSFLQLQASLFSKTMFDAADEWDVAKSNDADVQKEKEKLLVIRSSGYVSPGGIQFV